MVHDLRFLRNVRCLHAEKEPQASQSKQAALHLHEEEDGARLSSYHFVLLWISSPYVPFAKGTGVVVALYPGSIPAFNVA